MVLRPPWENLKKGGDIPGSLLSEFVLLLLQGLPAFFLSLLQQFLLCVPGLILSLLPHSLRPQILKCPSACRHQCVHTIISVFHSQRNWSRFSRWYEKKKQNSKSTISCFLRDPNIYPLKHLSGSAQLGTNGPVLQGFMKQRKSRGWSTYGFIGNPIILFLKNPS